MLCPRGVTKTIVLKSPDSDKVREVIVTSVLLPKSENEINRTPIKSYRNSGDMELVMEKRMYKRRLDHLSLEEKILRKKLKNREAAQTSRDRKKARLEELEASVLQLQNENESLHEEVCSLKDDKESLQRENARLTEEVWRLSVAGGASGPAAGSQSAPSTPPPLPPSPAPADSAASCYDEWSWLDDVPITPVVEELERLANSLFAEACNAKEPETQEENLVGPKTESLEPCWPCFNSCEEKLTNTNIESAVTYPATESTGKQAVSPSFPKLNVDLAQSLNSQSLETPKISVQISPPLKTPSGANDTEICTHSKNLDLKNEDISIEEFEQKPELFVPSDLNEMCVDDEMACFTGDGMDCVVKEEVVETTEYLAPPSPVCNVPSIVLTESADLVTEDEVLQFSDDLLAPGELMEECNSDHGYESYDSPVSESEPLVNLFPDLW